MRSDLVLSDSGSKEFHAFPMRSVTDRADDAEAFLFVLALDRARLHHWRHSVHPIDVVLLEDVDHIDVDEVDAELFSGDPILTHRLQHRARELVDLLSPGRSRGALDPGKRVTHVLLRNPRAMAFDLETEIALLEQNWPGVAAQHGVAQPWLQTVPAGG